MALPEEVNVNAPTRWPSAGPVAERLQAASNQGKRSNGDAVCQLGQAIPMQQRLESSHALENEVQRNS